MQTRKLIVGLGLFLFSTIAGGAVFSEEGTFFRIFQAKPPINMTIQRTYQVGDRFVGSGVPIRDTIFTLRAAGNGCVGFVRQDDGRAFGMKVVALSSPSLLAVTNEGLKNHAVSTPCHAFNTALSTSSKVTIEGDVVKLSGTDSAGRPDNGYVAVDSVEVKAADVTGALTVSDGPISSCSADGTNCGGTGYVKTVKVFRDDADTLCEATLTASGGSFRVIIEIPAPELFSSDRETIQNFTADSMVRSCDLLLEAFSGGNPVYAFGKKKTWGVIANPQLEIHADEESHTAPLPAMVF